MSATADSGGGKPGDNKVSEILFTLVPLDLFRMGNASGPRLDKIRLGTDVTTVEVAVGMVTKTMVPAEGGMSTFDAKNPALNGVWWCIPAGTALPDTSRVVKDNTSWNRQAKMHITHYSLRPSRLMTLEEYAQGLVELSISAVRDVPIINKQPENKANMK